ncbi:MAG: hypothetical protein AB7G48_20770 [Nitrospiraceae bacterium]
MPSAVEMAADLLMVGSLPARLAVADDQPSMTRDREHRVVFYLNSAEEQIQMRLLSNITHLYEALGPDCLRGELVAQGPGPSSLARKGSRFAGEVAWPKQQNGVELTVCSSTMEAQGLT